MPDVIEILDAGVLTTVQDRGRIGYAHLGVPRAGALDGPAAALANRLVGNDLDAAVLELTLGGLVAVNHGPGCWAALTGARSPSTTSSAGRDLPAPSRRSQGPEGPGGRAVPSAEPFWWPEGAVLTVGPPADGVRTYLAVAGGIDVEPVLGSRSTDTLAWVGPPRVEAGARLPLGDPAGPPRALDVAAPRRPGPWRVLTGPQVDWFGDALDAIAWTVRPESDRVGLRLDGPPLTRVREGELPSEGMVLGAIQVPPDGRPIVFLADHPPTGGYPVIGVVHPGDLWQCAQLRPGEPVRLRAAQGRSG